MSQAGILNVIDHNPDIPIIFDADTGSATAVLNIIRILGSGGITTTASGNTITISGSGLPSFEGLTPDDGAQVTSVGGNINVFGQKAGVVPVVETHNVANDFTVENRAWETQYVIDSSATVGLQGTFQTIQSALTQAVADGMTYTNPKCFYIRPGTYVENLTIPGGAFFEGGGYKSDSLSLLPLVTITGNHTLDAICVWGTNGIQWTCVSGNLITTGASFAIFTARNSNFYNSGAGKILQAPTGTTLLDWYNCDFRTGGTPFLSVMTIGSLDNNSIRSCVFNGCGWTVTSGTLRMEDCKDIGEVSVGVKIIASNCNFVGGNTSNITGLGEAQLFNCGFNNNIVSNYGCSLTLGATLTDCYLNSNSSIPGDLINPSVPVRVAYTQGGNVLKAVRTGINYIQTGDGDNYIGVTDTTAPRTVGIKRGKGAAGPLTDYQVFVIDESGAAATNSITVSDTSGALINGAASYVINKNFGAALFHTDGTNWFVTSAGQQTPTPITFTANTGGALTPVGNLNILGASVASGTTPVSTAGSASTITLNVQRTQAFASSSATRAGIGSFDSTYFTVDSNGFVSVVPSTIAGSFTVDAATAPGTNPVVPNVSGVVTITGGQVAAGTTTNVIRTNSLAANTYSVQVQRASAQSSTTIGSNGVCHFSSAKFTVDANGFVGVSGTGVGQTITGTDGGGARTPILGNWNFFGEPIAAISNPIEITGSLNNITFTVQAASAGSGPDLNQIGLAFFSDTDFIVDPDGFVTLVNSGIFVKNVFGTTNRITAINAAGDVTVDIDAAYVGQASITTLGTVTTGTWSATTIAPTRGGTGLTTYTTGDILYASATNVLSKRAVGSNGQVLTLAAGVPTWATPTTGTVTSVSGTANRITSTGGATPVIDISASYVGQSSITTLGTITTGVWNGTVLTPVYGGTGLATLTNHGVMIGQGTSNVAFAGPNASTSAVFMSAGSSADPAFTTTGSPTFAQTTFTGSISPLSQTALSAYSTGSFTPTLSFGGGTTGITYGANSGTYYLIGGIVFYALTITLTNKGSSTGSAFIDGFPIAAVSTASRWSTAMITSVVTATATYNQFYLSAQPTSTSFAIGQSSSLGSGVIAATDTNFANTSNILVSGHYAWQ